MTEDKVQLHVVDEGSETQGKTAPLPVTKAETLQKLVKENAKIRGDDVRTVLTKAKSR